MENYLRQSKKHVVVVHCLAGKGRTGVSICCFLLSTALFNEPQ